jgi:membrane-associated protease RseP (regulator of RpoE activity)
MSEENPSPSPSESSIPPVEPIVADDLDPGDATDATAPVEEPTPIAVSDPASAAAPAPPAPPSSHVLLPKWVVFGVVGIALACLGFGVGWIAKPDSDSSSRPAASAPRFPNGNPFGENGPFSGNNGGGNNNGGNGNGGIQVSGAFLGVSARSASADSNGVEIAQVVDGSPADDAGLATGDVITKVDDTSIDDPAALVEEIGGHDPGDEVTVTYTRDGDTKTAEVTLGDRADQEIPSPSERSGSED